MKKLNAYFPLWLLIMVPPIIFLTLAFNFIMVAIGLLLVFIIIDRENLFLESTKNILKLWGVTILLDIVSFIVMVLPEVANNIPFLKENLISPLETNPYTSGLSIAYMTFLLLLNILIIYFFVKKIIIKKHKLDAGKKRFTLFILIIFMLPYLFFIPSNKILKTDYNALEDYRGVIMENKKKVASLLKYLDSSKYISSYVLETHAEPYTVNIYMSEIDINYQALFEQDAAILLNLIDDVNEVKFYLDGKTYNYTINSINEIFLNVKRLTLDEIYARYDDDKFEEYTYLGNIKGFDVFDTSEFCELDEQLLFGIQDEEYYLGCTAIENILLYGDEILNIKEALAQNVITPNDIIESTIDLIVQQVGIDEDIS